MQLTKKQKKIFKISAITLGCVVALFVITGIGIRLILTDKSLTKLVNKYSNEYLNARVKIDTVSLELISEFPYVGVKLVNGEIISRAFENESDSLKSLLPPQADSLLSFKELLVSFSLPQLLASTVDIKRIKMVTPRVYAYVSPWGKANWDIMIADTTSKAESENFEINLNVNRVNIRDYAHIVYDSRPDSLMATVNLNKLRLKGKLTMDKNNLRFEKGYFSKFSITVEQLLAEKNLSPLLANLSDSLSIKNEQIGGTIKKTTASIMIDSLNIVSAKKGAFHLDALTHSNLKIGELTLAKNLPLEINGGFAFDTAGNHAVTLQELKVTAAEIPLVLNGKIKLSKDSLYTNDLCGRVDDFYLSHFFKYIPKQIFPDIDKIQTDAKFTVDVDINGSVNFNTGKMPSFVAQLNLPSSKVTIKGQKVGVKELAADIKAYYNANKPDSCGIDIKQFLIDGVGIMINSTGTVKNITGDPFIDMKFKSSLNMDTLAVLFPPKKSDLKIAGKFSANLEVRSLLSNLTPYKLANAFIKGDIDSDDFDISLPSRDFFCCITGMCLKAGAVNNTTDSTIQRGTKMLALDLTVDSAYVRHTDSLVIRANKVQIAGHNAASVLEKEKKVHPFNGVIAAKILEVDGIDSSRIHLRETKNLFSILPYKGDFSIPVIKVSSSNRRVTMRSNINRYSLGRGTIEFEAVRDRVNNKAQLAKLERRLDSLQLLYPDIKRDSLTAHARKLRSGNKVKDDFASENLDLGLNDKGLTAFIRQWNIKGSVKAATGRVTTPYFPLKTTLKEIDMAFTADSIVFKKTHFNLGESVIEATGKISGLRRSVLTGGGNGKLNIDFKIDADTLNFNELAYAATMGSEYADKSDEYKKELMKEANEDKLQKAITTLGTDTLQSFGLIIIPGNINANIALNVDYGKYSKLILNKVEGGLIVKNRCLQISGFKAITSAGEMDLDAFYSTTSKKDLAAGFDLVMKNMNIKQLLDLMPQMDTLLPMLNSFEGIFNCQIAGTTQLDTSMNVIFPSLRGVARIRGDNLVLMDGKTFAEISKMLRFKNKERNQVDHIAVEVMMKDNKIEIFPFIMEVDRYQTAISGEQDLDMNFKYHISVLKSPIPIRLGVNVFGNLDKFDFKIGKAKYKSANLPVYTQVIDDTRLNLRTYITNIFNKGVDAALKNATSTTKIEELKAKNKSVLDDSLESLTAQDSLLLRN